MTESFTYPAVYANPVAEACASEQYHCGHLTRSSSRAVKRALFLYLAEAADLGYLGGRNEPAEVLAALALMREGAACEAILAAADDPTAAAADMPSVTETVRPLTPEQTEVLGYVTEGYSYPEIAALTGRATETVRSLVKAAMRRTYTHTAIDAAVVAVNEGWL